MENRILIFAVHGFLGCSSDWNFISDSISSQFKDACNTSNIELQIPDLFSKKSSSTLPSFSEWTIKVNSILQDFKNKNYKIILIGYSLGGRLLCETIFNHPNLWDSAHLISSHLGLNSQDECKSRIINDENWALKFSNLEFNWDLLLQSWNNQPVLKNDFEPSRVEQNYNRELLSQAFKVWTLGKQKNYFSQLSGLKKGLHLWSGKDDIKFSHHYSEAAQINSLIIHHLIKDQKHRLIFNKEFQKEFLKFNFFI